jgi:hypothetical protein
VSGLLIAEGILRVAIALHVRALRLPELYADDLSEEDYFKLRRRWIKNNHMVERGWSHPVLGWAPPATPENPLGAVTPPPYALGETGTILFFGDSFVFGATPFPHRIPQLLSEMIPERHVLNLGVGSYGVDQIYLRFRLALPHFEGPIVLFGILTQDLDRAVLTVRAGQKPRFVPVGRRLTLTNLPIADDQPRWFVEHPPQVWSYLLRFARRQIALFRVGGDRLALPAKRREKEVIGARLLRKTVALCRARNVPLVFVLFYGQAELQSPSWRGPFFTTELDRLQADYVDTKPVLLAAAERDHVAVGSYYQPNSHPTRRGNLIIATAIADRLHDRGL